MSENGPFGRNLPLGYGPEGHAIRESDTRQLSTGSQDEVRRHATPR